MTIETTRFDATQHLDDPQDHIDLLSDALATRDPRVIVNMIAIIARARGMTGLSEATGIGRSTLYKAIADDANPTLETLLKLLGGLEIELSARRAA